MLGKRQAMATIKAQSRFWRRIGHDPTRPHRRAVMLTWLRNIFAQWAYVGTVEAHTQLVDDEGNAKPGGRSNGYFILSEKPGGTWRRVKKVGDAGTSPF